MKTTTVSKPKLEEARKRWGMAVVLSGTPIPAPRRPNPSAPAAAIALPRAA